MKSEHFTETQIVSVVKLFEGGMPAKDIIRAVRISEATLYDWVAVYGGQQDPNVMRLEELEAEHAELENKHDELKKMYAEVCVENRVIFQEVRGLRMPAKQAMQLCE
jgi:putative transposase